MLILSSLNKSSLSIMRALWNITRTNKSWDCYAINKQEWKQHKLLSSLSYINWSIFVMKT